MKSRINFRKSVNKKAENLMAGFFVSLLLFWMVFVPFPTIAVFSGVFYKHVNKSLNEDLLGNAFTIFSTSLFSLAWTHYLCFEVYKLI